MKCSREQHLFAFFPFFFDQFNASLLNKSIHLNIFTDQNILQVQNGIRTNSESDSMNKNVSNQEV